MARPSYSLLYAVAGLLAFTTHSIALDPQKPVRQYSHTFWRSEDGLPDNFVQTLIQTRDGYLWLGTLEGLARFDGFQFTTFDTQNTPALRHNSVVSLCEDRNGVLWIGTSGGGIARYENGRFIASYDTSNGLPNDYVRTIYEDREGTLWITAHAGGLVRLRDGKLTVYGVKDGLPTESLRTAYQDTAGNIWVGTDEHGLCLLRSGGFECFSRRDGLASDQVRVLYEDRRGRLWVGTRAGGLHLRDGNRFRAHAVPGGLPKSAIRSMTEDRDGNLWVGTEGGGAFRMRDGVFSTISTHDGLLHNFVRSILEDRDGNLWLGTRGGLSRLKDKNVVTWTTADGLVNDNVHTVFEDSQGRVWIGTSTGVSRIENGRAQTVRLSSEWSRDVVRSLAEGRDGTIWIGADSGLFRWRGGSARRVEGLEGNGGGPIRALLEDRHGRLWIGTDERFGWMEAGTFRTCGVAEGCPEGSVSAIAEDRTGALWFGTDRGLVAHAGGRFERYSSRDGLPDERITALRFDSTGTLWIATRGGLSRLRDGRFTSFTRRDGLLSDNVLQVVEDKRAHLWLSSSRGVSRISLKDLNGFASGNIRELRPVLFDTADGMKSRECNGDAQPAGWRTRDGRVWFATVHGAVAFDPQAIRGGANPPRVVVEKVLTSRLAKAVLQAPVSMPAGSGDFEVQFTAISLGAPERVRFRYRLENFDTAWVDAGGRRSAWYTNVPPGEYRFQLMAYAADGSWQSEEAVLELNLAPRFHQTAWFYVLCAIALAGLGLLAYRVRISMIHRRYEAVLEERARIGREIHDTLMQGVTGISLQIEVASQKLPEAPLEAKGQLSRALGRLDEVLRDARRCILELRPTNSGDADLEASIREMAQEMAAGRGIAVSVAVEGKTRPLPVEVQSQLLRIAREAVTNSVVHAKASQLRVVLSFGRNEVRLSAIDDGCGFDAQTLGRSQFGIVGIRERTEKLGGKLAIRTAPGRGTEITVAVPTTRFALAFLRASAGSA